MAAPAAPFLHTFRADDAPIGSVLPSYGSPLFVLNKDATAVTGTAGTDDWQSLDLLFSGSITNGENVVPVAHPRAWNTLEVGLAIMRETDSEEITASPEIAIFGRSAPSLRDVQGYPAFIGPSEDANHSWNLDQMRRGLWFALRPAGASPSSIPFTLPTGLAVATLYDSVASARVWVTDFVSIPLRGALDVVATIKNAGTTSAGALVLVGRFVS